MVVTDADKRAAIAEIYNSVGAEYLAQKANTEKDPQARRVYESATALTSTLADVPVYVIPCIEKRMDGLPLVAAASAWASIIPAAWSFLLALRSRGLGSVWTTLHLAKEREVAELLGIPDRVTQVALFPVAYTIGTDFKPAKRAAGGEHHLVEHMGRTLTGQATPPVGIWRHLSISRASCSSCSCVGGQLEGHPGAQPRVPLGQHVADLAVGALRHNAIHRPRR